MTAVDPSVTGFPQRYLEDVQAGDRIAPVEFPITVYRLVMAAGANATDALGCSPGRLSACSGQDADEGRED